MLNMDANLSADPKGKGLKMADMENWCTNQITKLLNQELRMESLQEIYNHLTSISQDEAEHTIRYLELSAIFDCLNDTNSTVVELACVTLTACMSNLSLGDTINRYSSFLERALDHPDDKVKVMVLKEILRNSSNEDSLMILVNQNNLIHMTINCIGTRSMDVVIQVRNIIVNMMKSSNGIQKLLSPNTISFIKDLTSRYDMVFRIRLNKMFINGAIESEEFMKGLIVTGFLPIFLSEHDSPDVISTMYIESLSKLAITEHGYLYLESAGVLRRIFDQLNPNNEVIGDLCQEDVLKFFGHIARWRPKETMKKYPEIIHNLFSKIVSNDVILLNVALDIIGHMGESNEGKLALNSRGVQFITVLQVLCHRLLSLPAHLRIGALRCIESLIRITVFNNEIANLVHKWFSLMNEDSLNLVYINARHNVKDIRLAGLHVINALALHNWGQECFRKSPGFVEFLLYRGRDGDKETNEILYEIIKILASSTLFEPSTLTRFQKYVEEGPFYVQAITAVAVEGED